ncbi:hypothetical protein HU749_016145 [Pseudomonas ogarae]|uniref:hypothetical protein n=1 Tax=Pseudomonas ogarae (strain DSM 112162 / CECT 30235 / F113) TaxID=1114970 RepID=UPI001646927A|nr:hypothetical protein [Pseudomonas zarinae]QXH92403.1 hypothetical protein HU749_016145 [Pseudomonas zarinae]
MLRLIFSVTALCCSAAVAVAIWVLRLLIWLTEPAIFLGPDGDTSGQVGARGQLAGHVEARAATVIRSIPMTAVMGEKQAATQGQGGQQGKQQADTTKHT